MATRINTFKRKPIVVATPKAANKEEKPYRGNQIPGFRGKAFGICSIVFFFDFVKAMVFGILAILFGNKKRDKGVVAMGIIGISLSVLFYAISFTVIVSTIYLYYDIATYVYYYGMAWIEYFVNGDFIIEIYEYYMASGLPYVIEQIELLINSFMTGEAQGAIAEWFKQMDSGEFMVPLKQFLTVDLPNFFKSLNLENIKEMIQKIADSIQNLFNNGINSIKQLFN